MQKIYINARFLTQPVTGVQRYGIELVQALDTLIAENDDAVRNVAFELVAPKRGLLHRLDLKNIPLRCTGKFTGHYWEQVELPDFVRDGLLFCPGNTAPLKSLRRQKVVVCVHSLAFRYLPEAYSRLFRTVYNQLMPKIFRHARAVITVSESEKKYIGEHFPGAKAPVVAVQNGGISAAFRESLVLSQSQKSAADSPYLLFVGSFSRVKNLENVLAALHLLHRDFPKLTLRIVGAKARSFNDLSTKIDEQLRPKIVFEGQINDTVAMIKLYQNAAALVFPSFYEASPLPPIEAMSCGCPVVASDIPSLRERCGNTAEYCRPESPESIATAIAAILSDAQFAEHLRQNGLARAAEFSWERCARETLAVFRNVLSTD